MTATLQTAPEHSRPAPPAVEAGGLLCVANFPSDTGYAWSFIERLYAGVAEALGPRGVRTWVAYPELRGVPATLRGSAAAAVELALDLGDPRSVRRLLRFVRANDVRVIYLSDRATWHPVYPLLRWAGVRRIVVHDHTSGERTRPRGWKRWAKQARGRLPGTLADAVIGVSDYVVRRKLEVDLVPRERVVRIANAVTLPEPRADARARLRAAAGVDEGRPLIVCACRTSVEKGVDVLLRAFDRLAATYGHVDDRPVLVYMGDGPAMPALRALRDTLAARDAIVFTGFVPDAPELLAGADVCVVPSVWQEAFGLAALEPMAHGVPVVASAVGGIPEVVVDAETGVLVPPGDAGALADALARLLHDPAARERFGRAGRQRAIEHFSFPRAIAQLADVLAPGFTR